METPDGMVAPDAGQVAEPSTGDVGATTPDTPSVDSFTSIDPNTLPPELSGVYKSMQGDYTRKTQEIAQYRNLGDVEQLQQAMEFTTALQSDPNFAKQVYEEMGQALRSQGLIHEANQMQAQADIAGQQAPPPDSDLGDGYGDDPIAKELNELKEWAQKIEQERIQSQYETDLNRQESLVRQSNPNWGDEDVQAVYQLAFAHGGNLLAAEKAYKDLQHRLVGKYVEQKSSVPAAHQQPPATPGAIEPPAGVSSLMDPKVDQAVQAYLRGLDAQG